MILKIAMFRKASNDMHKINYGAIMYYVITCTYMYVYMHVQLRSYQLTINIIDYPTYLQQNRLINNYASCCFIFFGGKHRLMGGGIYPGLSNEINPALYFNTIDYSLPNTYTQGLYQTQLTSHPLHNTLTTFPNTCT